MRHMPPPNRFEYVATLLDRTTRQKRSVDIIAPTLWDADRQANEARDDDEQVVSVEPKTPTYLA